MLCVEKLTYQYSRSAPAVLSGVDLRLEGGQVGILLGKNGAGKTTLFKNILGIRRPGAGTIRFQGEDLQKISRSHRARYIAYVPQDIQFGALTVFDSVLMGRVSRFGFRAGQEDLRVTEQILEEMGLAEFAHRNVDALSGGERQKVAIARAMAQEPRLMVFDEPTGNLDIANEELILREARRLAREKGMAVLCSLHDLNRALQFGDKFFLMKDGIIRYAGGKECITERTIRDVYGVDVKIAEIDGEKVIIGGNHYENQ